MVNRSTGKSPFAIVYCHPPNHALDLVPLPKLPRKIIAAEHMAEKISTIRKEVLQNLETSTNKYKEAAYKKWRLKVF